MKSQYGRAVIKGLMVAIFLQAIGMQGIEHVEWWVAMISLNVMANF